MEELILKRNWPTKRAGSGQASRQWKTRSALLLHPFGKDKVNAISFLFDSFEMVSISLQFSSGIFQRSFQRDPSQSRSYGGIAVRHFFRRDFFRREFGQDSLGFFGIFRDSLGFLRIFLRFSGILLEFSGILWDSLGFSGILWDF